MNPKLKVLVFALLFFSFAGIPEDVSAQACNNNGTCETNEDRCSCPNDCGSCGGDVPGVLCQYYTCLTGTCRATSKPNCCGNDLCEAGEDYANCSRDCPPEEVRVEVLKPDANAVFMRGDFLLFRARVKGDGAVAKNANVRADTFVGTVHLYDDGNHQDVLANDGIYAGGFTIPEYTEKNDYTVPIIADVAGVSDENVLVVKVDPSLDFLVELDSESYSMGDVVYAEGNLSKRGTPLSREAEFKIFSESGELIYGKQLFTDSNGNFSLDYHSSLIQPPGTWTLSFEAFDREKNLGKAEFEVPFSVEGLTRFLDLGVLSPREKVFERAEEVKLLVSLDFEGKPVKDAEVRAILPDKKILELREGREGKYSLSFNIPVGFPLGDQNIFLLAKKDFNAVTYSGSAPVELIVEKAQIRSEVIEPSRSFYALGEEIKARVKLTYSSGQPAANAETFFYLNDERLQVRELGGGVYAASYPLTGEEISESSLELAMEFSDLYGNSGAESISLEINRDVSFLYFLRRQPLLAASFFVVLSAVVLVLLVVRRRRGKLGSLKKRAEELKKIKSELQDRYFNRGAITSEEYYSLLNQYSSELRDIEATIASLKRKEKGMEGEEAKRIEDEMEKQDTIVDSPGQKVSLFRLGKKGSRPQGESEKGGLFTVKKKTEKKKSGKRL